MSIDDTAGRAARTTTPRLTALETEYAGCRFRSRLEARWAVFFDALGVKWEYEPEGYQVGPSECYLPDFRLPNLNAFYEVKGQKVTHEYMRMLHRFTRGLPEGWRTLLAVGDIPRADPGGRFIDNDLEAYWVMDGEDCWDDGYLWCKCPKCGAVGIEFSGRVERLDCPCYALSREFAYDHPAVMASYKTARSARFGVHE